MVATDDTSPDSLLAAGRTVWRVEKADRFAILMENETYFDALASAISKAQRSIVLLGWQFDPAPGWILRAGPATVRPKSDTSCGCWCVPGPSWTCGC